MITIRVSRSVYRLQKCGKSRYPCLSLLPHLRPMSSEAIAKLPSPLKDLVAASVSEASVDSEAKPGVDEWIEKVASGQFGKAESLKDLNAQLTPRTYVVDNVMTSADVAVYGALHPTISQWQPAQYYSHPALTRYFDHIQNRPAVRTSAEKLSPAYSLVSFDLDSAPAQERKAEPPKKKEKKPVTEAVKEKVSEVKDAVKQKVAAVSEKATSKKEKKEKADKKPAAAVNEEGGKKKGESPPKQAAAEDAGEPQPSMIDLRVGKIVEISKHPDADSLYVEKIDFGEETGPRTVVSGLVKYIPIEEMRDRYLVGVCNLKPASMRGVKSFAMVLCATSKDGKEGGIELVKPPENSKIGDKVYFEGPDYENATPLSQLNPKKKIFETIQPSFTTLDTREAAWVNPLTKSVHRIRTKDGVCAAPTFVGASLS
ncbi:hypothetical protein BJ322DRAFT_1070150 [Thelephora terrestris]|uniref:Nucleic acid-binding protein n=1 Tax=Thelephora terrestris TaxID=56493 RepID=A0A9P6L5D8_9AGAM|nr:hypothetical protein BJ322DRAFT_1070150 [Thelephora terrestris]